MAQPCRGEGQTYQRHGHQDRCHPNWDRHMGVHVHVTNTTGIHTGWPLTMPQRFYNYSMTQYKRWAACWPKTISFIQRWAGSNRQNCVKRQVYSHTNQVQTTGVGPASYKPYGYRKNKLLAHESVYWHSINVDIEKYIKNCATCLELQQMQPKEKIIHHDIPLRPWEVLGADVFHFNNKNYLCVMDYHSKFPIIKRLEGLSAENLITTTKVICWHKLCFRQILPIL